MRRRAGVFTGRARAARGPLPRAQRSYHCGRSAREQRVSPEPTRANRCAPLRLTRANE